MLNPASGRMAQRGVSMLLLCQTAAVLAADPDCWCRDPDGQRRNLGTVECVNITGRDFLVRCEMSTNTPFWKRVADSEGCPLT